MNEIDQFPEEPKIGMHCPCGGRLYTITSEFTIECADRIAPEEIVRCESCSREFDEDQNDVVADRKAVAA